MMCNHVDSFLRLALTLIILHVHTYTSVLMRVRTLVGFHYSLLMCPLRVLLLNLIPRLYLYLYWCSYVNAYFYPYLYLYLCSYIHLHVCSYVHCLQSVGIYNNWWHIQMGIIVPAALTLLEYGICKEAPH